MSQNIFFYVDIKLISWSHKLLCSITNCWLYLAPIISSFFLNARIRNNSLTGGRMISVNETLRCHMWLKHTHVFQLLNALIHIRSETLSKKKKKSLEGCFNSFSNIKIIEIIKSLTKNVSRILVEIYIVSL